MFANSFQTSDVLGSTFAAATMGCFATAALMALGLTWVSERWRIPVALAAVALAISAFSYMSAEELWLSGGKLSSAPRFAAWFAVHPLLVAAAYFFVGIAGSVPAGVFWRITVAALLMVLSRYLGDAHIFNPTLGVLLSIAFWLYILGEMYFGRMADVMRKASPPMQIGYFWIRLIMTVGWVVIPILHFVDVVIGVGYTPVIATLYTIADLVNLVALALTYLAVAGKERY
jgi:sensory rhodopsin